MIRLKATIIQLSPKDLNGSEESVQDGPPPIDLLATSLRPEATEFVPQQDMPKTSQVVDAQAYANSIPSPSPHLDRYPMLFPPNRRRNTTRTGVRPSFEPRYTPSPNSDRSVRHTSIERVSARLKERSTSLGSQNVGAESLRHDSSPLEQLVKDLRLVSASLPKARSGSRATSHSARTPSSFEDEDGMYDIYENEPPVAMTISRAPSHQCQIHPPYHASNTTQQASIEDSSLPRVQDMRFKASITSRSAKRCVQVYHDNPVSFRCETTPSDQAKRHRRAQVFSNPVEGGAEVSIPRPRPQRYTYPQTFSGGQDGAGITEPRQRLFYRPAPENDEAAQLQTFYDEHIEQDEHDTHELEQTPPTRPRYADYVD